MRNSAARPSRAGRFLPALGLALAFGAGVPDAAAQVLPPNPNPAACSVSSTEFNGWFASGQAGLNGLVNPADGAALDTSANCNFYKWAQQMFLWLTSPATGPYQGGLVLDSQVFYQVVGSQMIPVGLNSSAALAAQAPQTSPQGLPVVMDAKGHLRAYVTAPADSEGALLAAVHKGRNLRAAKVRAGTDGKVVLLDKAGKTIGVKPQVTADMLPKDVGRLAHLAKAAKGSAHNSARARIAEKLTSAGVLVKFGDGKDSVFAVAGTGEIVDVTLAQAGSSGVLVSQTGSMVYYEKLVNDVFAWYLTGRKTYGGIAPLYNENDASTYGQFPTTTQQVNQVIAFNNGTLGFPTLSFPDAAAMAVELKLSWVDASTLPSTAGYVTKQALLPVYNRSNPMNWVPTGATQTATVALVGMHVVGSANNHPEMIWATFEHQANSPPAAYTYVNAAGQTVTVPQNTSGSWLFSADGAQSPYNNQLAKYQSSGAIAATGTAPIGPSNVLHQKAWGAASDGAPNQHDSTAAQANTDVIMLNTSVRQQLAAAGAASDPRASYLFMGATWTNNGGEPTTPYPAGGNILGSSTLSNSTMETYTQGADSTYQTGANCFSCHSSSGSNPSTPADTYVSHIFASSSPFLPLPLDAKAKKAKK